MTKLNDEINKSISLHSSPSSAATVDLSLFDNLTDRLQLKRHVFNDNTAKMIILTEI